MKTKPRRRGRDSCLLFALLLLAGCARGPAPLTVYCAHDSVFAEAILQDFTRRTGIPVAVRYDTEATKSLGLVELLLREQTHPQCDVFWNNELLGTLQLAEAGVLEPYTGPGAARIPAAFKDPAGRWTGFAARLRVIITNTNAPATAGSAMAKPLFGTTRTHYTVLWREWGPARLQEWHRAKPHREVAGNAAVKDLVANAVCQWGYTDTDDFFEAKDAGRPVTLRPVTLANGATICIPNTVMIIRGTPRLAAARQLVDYLLAADTELALARAKSRQIPLGPVDDAQLPAEVRELRAWAAHAYPLNDLGPARADCLAWLKTEYLK